MTSPRIGITPELVQTERKLNCVLDIRYVQAVETAGGIPWIIPPVQNRKKVLYYARHLDGFLFTGGDDIDPRYYGQRSKASLTLSPDLRTEFELSLLRDVMKVEKPVLGICLGTQLINVALGGTLIQDIPLQLSRSLNHRGVHVVSVSKNSFLSRIVGNKKTISIQSSHHQAIDRLGKGLEISGTAPDGIIEAVEYPDYPFFIGIQWHPERGKEKKHDRLLFKAFVRACTVQ
ncbi:MAG: gamma-glutamyl-gamma-aminobutyrate hydrolase family protein [Nitrospirae bacterium]|nr:gamma-glutamyl-gamma-aminobutyrate hydrolase family protein [Nitrospirota bacterium]